MSHVVARGRPVGGLTGVGWRAIVRPFRAWGIGASRPGRGSGMVADDLRATVAQLRAENAALHQALMAADAREAAISEILRSIAASPADAQPVLDAVVES